MEGCLLLFKQLRPVSSITSHLARVPMQYGARSFSSGQLCRHLAQLPSRQASLCILTKHNLQGSSLFAGLLKQQPRCLASLASQSAVRHCMKLRGWTGNGSSLFASKLRQGRPGLIGVVRFFTEEQRLAAERKRSISVVFYVFSTVIFMIGMTYAGVPLYRIFCQATGLGGEVAVDTDGEKLEKMQKVEDRIIKIRFNADTAASMRWNFRPQQTEVKVLPGETALAFYTAKNPTDKAIVGISTYNVVPFEAGQYFNKIQCFCFEEQRLNPHEQVDMPVFFYIDPDFASDPNLENTDTITLSYTFFEAKEGLHLPVPSYYTT